MQRLSVEYVNEAKEYYLYNGTGSVVQTTAQNGSAFLRYTYDPFGNVTSINAPMTVDIDDLNRYTYNGEDYDYNTGIQYLRARYYDTSVGSFISQDTYLGNLLNPLSQNRYTYCHNSPVMFDDPSGHSVILGLLIAGGILLVSCGIKYGVADHHADEAEEAYDKAKEEYEKSLAAMNESLTKISELQNLMNDNLALGEIESAQETFLKLQVEYAKYENAYVKACSSYEEMNKQIDKFDSANKWKNRVWGSCNRRRCC